MPDNSGSMVAAYVAAALIFGLYTVSLVLRRRKVRDRSSSR